MRVEWLTRMSDAINAMERTMEEPLDIEKLAKTAYSSPFHFQRMFGMLTGMTVGEYVRKRKLTLAAQELASSSSKVLDIALKYGYDSPESFAKAFRKLHGIPPSDARKPGVSLKAFPRISFRISLKGDKDMDYRIVEKNAFKVIGKGIETTSAEGENSRDIPRFWQESNRNGMVGHLISLVGGADATLGICMDMAMEKGTFTYMIAVENKTGVEAPEGFVVREIPAHTWAVFTSIGPMPHAIQDVWMRVFQEWFPATGYEHAGGPEMESYPEGDVNADDYRCEVWVPIVKR
ncbi:MAG: AraC family transcriptional regulator [Cohnella sp.]|nr:AraC family transcriptional regulator [Cohnella sp.]